MLAEIKIPKRIEQNRPTGHEPAVTDFNPMNFDVHEDALLNLLSQRVGVKS
jgi:hypothetical protein